MKIVQMFKEKLCKMARARKRNGGAKGLFYYHQRHRHYFEQHYRYRYSWLCYK